ncbi:MAG: V-type ATP synthase subunit I [Methanobacteriota archaeon]|nr:MAG: V-type ATP synthase subunit I [Euryarchaeota archaeon]
MLRPVPMTRALIVGPRDELEATIERLYDLKLLHIVDHKEGEEGLEIGKPLLKASEASEILVKLRSLASVLQLEDAEPAAETGLTGDLRQKILSLELNISEEDTSKKKIQSLLADLDRKIEEMTPFAELPLALQDYRGYERLEVFVGKAPRDIDDLDTVTTEYEAFAAPGLLAVFVVKAAASAMREFLAQRGFTNLPIPAGEGRPGDLLADLRAEKVRWEARSKEIEERLTTLRERYAGFLVAARAHLETQVEKAEAPLRFAVTDHTFLVDGWVPTAVFPEMKGRLERESHLLVSELEVAAAHEEPAVEPPVELRNPRPIRPFEMLIHMFGTPSYHELDPTLVFSLAFPVMFGIMVGDLGYGAVWVVYGLWLLRRWKDKPWGFWKNLTVAFVWGGLWASVFGAFVFGEAFGIPFHAPDIVGISRAEAFNWSDDILHVSIPLFPFLEKLHQVTDFIVLSLAIAYLHLSVGFAFGVVNEARHNPKHAIGKVGWLLILTGLFIAIMDRAGRWHGTLGYAIWNGLLGWVPRTGLVQASFGFSAANPIPYLALAMLGVGVVLMLATEGFLHIMEVFGLLANVVSYARLAGIGVAEETVIFALNSLILTSFLFPWIDSGNVVGLVLGLVFVGLANFLLFVLSTISGAIQSVRLNYVEFFLKFYKGSGTRFRPFGLRTKAEV